MNSGPCSASVDCHFGRFIGYGNSIIFIVASCAVVVIIVSGVVMFLACRICSQRSEELHRLSRISENEFQRQCLSASMHHRVSIFYVQVTLNLHCVLFLRKPA